MISPVLQYGDLRLRKKCDDVLSIGESELRILDDMEDTMRAHSCIGFSAPQIGELKRLFIVNAGGVFIRGANPEIISEGALSEDMEGSPCVPGIQRPVRRPSKITCRYLAEDGKSVTLELKGLPARVFCHEKDHHEGILFVDRLKPVQQKLLQRELERIASKTVISDAE